MSPIEEDPMPDFLAARRVFAVLHEDDDEATDDVAKVGDEQFPLIADYLIDQRLGSGGGGVVYRALHEGSQRTVAIKILNRRLGEDSISQRAWRELDLLSQLRLPCVPQVQGFGEHDGRLYLATDYIDGLSLTDHCEEHELDRETRVGLLAQVADAVQSLHEHGVIHRDVKPDNIIINTHGQPIIVDLGIAAMLTDNVMETITTEGAPIGSPAFMAPEQARGERENISTRSDVYSLGATAFYILTGEPPHDLNATVHEMIHRVGHEPPRDPRELDKTLPRPLAAVLSKAVWVESEHRYESAAQFGADLRRWLAHDPVEASGLSTAHRVVRLIGRHPIITSASASIAVALIVFAATYFSMWLVNSRPYKVRISADGSIARLVSFSENTLHEWDAGNDRGVVFAQLVSRSADMGGDAIVIGLSGGAQCDYAGELCLYRLDDLDTPFWRSGTHPSRFEMPEPISDVSKARFFQVSWVGIDDIFTGDDTPGPEIVVIHCHSPSSPNVIRVYRLNGEVLYEAWHDGHIRNGYWMAKAGVLVLCGVNGEGGWKNRGLLGPLPKHPPFIVFALDPELNEINCEWIHTPGGDGAYEPLWYKCLRPTLASDIFDPMSPGSSLVRPADSSWVEDYVILGVHEYDEPRGGINLCIDAEGKEHLDKRVVGDPYYLHSNWPDPDEFFLGDLPPKLSN